MRPEIISLALLLALGAPACKETDRALCEINGSFPEDMNVGFIFRFEHPPSNFCSTMLRLTPDGTPYLFMNISALTTDSEKGIFQQATAGSAIDQSFGLRHLWSTFVLPLKEEGTGDRGSFFLLLSPEDVAFAEDGAMLGISDRTLVVFDEPKNWSLTYDDNALHLDSRSLLDLPVWGARISPAGNAGVYLYGQTQFGPNVFLYQPNGEMRHLFKAGGDVSALCGDGHDTYYAVGKDVYLLSGSENLLLYSADATVTALALAPPYGLFYLTEYDTVGYIYGRGRAFTFLSWTPEVYNSNGCGLDIQVSGGELYVFFPSIGVMRCAPIESLAKLAAELDHI